MSCKELLNTQSYLDGELAGADAAQAERHLQTCAECQAFAAGAADVSDSLREASRWPRPCTCAPWCWRGWAGSRPVFPRAASGWV